MRWTNGWRWLALAGAAVTAGGVVVGADAARLWWATRQPGEEAARMAAAVGIQPGDTVAEIGAGAGEMADRLAALVGPQGRLYVTELGAQRVAVLRARFDGVAYAHVDVREASATASGLPEACCALIYMRLVYHHLEDPVAYLRDVGRALVPGGRLVVIDFTPVGLLSLTAPSARRGHGVAPDDVVAEARAAGLTVEQVDTSWTGRTFLVRLQRPFAAGPP